MQIKYLLSGGAAAIALSLSACDTKTDAPAMSAEAETPVEAQGLPEIVVTDAELEGNPFRQEWDTPYGVPPFADIRDEHYMPATRKPFSSFALTLMRL